jgi:hypothetical protein
MNDGDEHLPIIGHLEPMVLNIDYFDLSQVKVLAKRLASRESMTVVKYPDRPNYNIIHTANEIRLPEGVRIVWRTSEGYNHG